MQPADVPTYNEVALGVNAPIYAYYAERIAERTGIADGYCLDVGCGGGYLGLALARITALDLIFFDQSPAMLACAEENIVHFGCQTRARTLLGRVQAIPLADGAIDLVISRGSLPFWDDLPAAFDEIHRVLRPGGQAYIGGGLGDPGQRAELERQLQLRHPEWGRKDRRPPQRANQEYGDALKAAGIDPFLVRRSDEGLWITFRKNEARRTR
jgi:ubiquinone/menaquinone biosynthesis C-methylase UbiE